LTSQFENSIIRELERRKAAINKALDALREIDDDVPEWVVSSRVPSSTSAATDESASGRKGKKRSAAVRKKMAEAQRARWRKIKGE
jgi:hypothetical protein